MKRRRFFAARRFFRRFNPWLFLVCILLAVIIWCAALYVQSQETLTVASTLPAIFTTL